MTYPHPLALASLAVLWLGTPGCITYAPPQCQGGYCHVGYQAIPPRTPDSVKIHPKGEHLPPGAVPMGAFVWPGSVFDRCSDEILGFFRTKAANLGFDGVAEIHVVWGDEKPEFVMLDARGGVFDSQKYQATRGREGDTLTGSTPLMMSSKRIDAHCVGIPYVFVKKD